MNPGSISLFVTIALTLTTQTPTSAVAACVEPPSDLTAWWPGESSAQDVAGGNDGVLGDGTTFVSGAVRKAFRIPGTTGRVRVPASSGIDVGTGTGFTVELWLNPDSNAAREPVIEWNRQTGTPNWGVHLWIATRNGDLVPHTGNVYANLVDTAGTSHIFYSDDGFVSSGVFQHIALTYDKASGKAKLYHQGVPIKEADLGTFVPQTSYDLFFGNRPGPSQPTSFAGSVDEVTLYDRALSGEEILAIKDAGTSGKCRSLCGDANDDGNIKASDALFVLQSAVGSATCGLCVCDVNKSGGISASDALSTLKNAVGVDLALVCPLCAAG